MIVEKEKLVKLLEHDSESVRFTAATSLSFFFHQDKALLTKLLHLIENSENTEYFLGLINYLEYFQPKDDSDFQRIIALLQKLQELDSDELELEVAIDELIEFIYNYPVEILEKYQDILLGNEDFTNLQDVIKQKNEIQRKTPVAMWDELQNYCNRYTDTVMPDNEFHYSLFLVESLSSHKKFVEDRVKELLGKKRDELDYHRVVFALYFLVLCEIDGYVGYAIGLLQSYELDDVQHDLCLDYLATIANVEVVNKLSAQYGNLLEMNFFIADILARIPIRESEQTLLQLLSKEEDLESKTLLAGSLMEIYSKEAIAKVAEMIRQRKFVASIADLYESLEVNLAYHSLPLEPYKELEEIYAQAIEEEMDDMEELDEEEIHEFTSSNGGLQK